MSQQQGGLFPGFLKTAFFLGFAACVGLLFRQNQRLRQYGYNLKCKESGINDHDLVTAFKDPNNQHHHDLKSILNEFEEKKGFQDCNLDTQKDNRFLILKNVRPDSNDPTKEITDYYAYAQGVDGQYSLIKIDKNVLEGLESKRFDDQGNPSKSGLIEKVKNIFKKAIGIGKPNNDAQIIERIIDKFKENGHTVTGERRTFSQQTVDAYSDRLMKNVSVLGGGAMAASASAMGLIKQMPTMLGYQAMNRAFTPGMGGKKPSLEEMAKRAGNNASPKIPSRRGAPFPVRGGTNRSGGRPRSMSH